MAEIIPTGVKPCPYCYRLPIEKDGDRWTGYKCGDCKRLFAINLKYETNGMITCPYCRARYRFGEKSRRV